MAANHGGFVERERLSRTYQTSVNLNVSIILIWNRYYMKKKIHILSISFDSTYTSFFPPFLMSDHFKHHENAIWLHMPIYLKLNLIVKNVLWTEEFHCFSKLCPSIAALKLLDRLLENMYIILSHEFFTFKFYHRFKYEKRIIAAWWRNVIALIGTQISRGKPVNCSCFCFYALQFQGQVHLH